VKLSQIGEFGLIGRLAKLIGEPKGQVVIGVGDDCAVIDDLNSKYEILSKSKKKNTKFKTYQLITTDTLIENVHFQLHGTANELKKLGQKAMAANISDIAAMGGWPTFAVVTIGASKNSSVEAIEYLYRGMLSQAKKCGIQIVGGDTVLSPQGLIISITLLGEVEKEHLLTRFKAKVGDIIIVTGKFGGGRQKEFDTRKLNVASRIKEAQIIAKSQLAASMIDSSDGLIQSILEICRASKVGARINSDQVPIAPHATLEQALYGGEEYELVFTIKRDQIHKLPKLQAKIKIKLSVVGEIVGKGKGVKLMDSKGKEVRIKSGGYEHFR